MRRPLIGTRTIAASAALGAVAVCSAIILSAITPAALAQGARADYERANNVRRLMQGKASLGLVSAHWLESGDSFWYRSDRIGGTRRFWLVDAAKGTKVPAFDHVKMAAALAEVIGGAAKFEADRLPVENISYPDARTVIVQIRDKSYACDLATYRLQPSQVELGRATPLPPGARERASRASDQRVELRFLNKTDSDIKLQWIDTDRQPHDYASLKPGDSVDESTYVGHLWRAVRVRDGEPLAEFYATESPALAVIDGPVRRAGRAAAPQSNSAISPDRRRRVVFRANNVILHDEQTGADTPLTTDGSPSDSYDWPAYWSPDGKRLVVLKTVPEQEHKVYLIESSPTDQVQPKVHVNQYLKPGDQVAHPRPHLFDVAGATPKEISVHEDLFPNPWSIDDLQWNADSSRFTFVYNQRGHQVLRLIAVDAQTGAASAVIDEQSKTFIDYSGKMYLDRLAGDREAIWMSERDGWNHLYLIDTVTGRIKNQITRGNWVVRTVDRVDETARQIWFQAGGIVPGQDPYYVQFCRINFDGTDLTLLTAGDGTHAVTYSPDGKYLIDSYSRVDMAPVTELRKASDGARIVDLERGDASGLEAAGWRLPERFVSKGRDGVTDIYGVIVRPSNFDPHRRYPIVESIYAGPQDSFVPKAFGRAEGLQAMAELGFIVVQIDGMGTSSRSKAFHDVCWKNLSDGGFPDRVLWIKAAATKHPEMDISRIGIYGTSAGGQNALAGLLLHGDFYKVGVADCGCHDNRMDKIWWNEQWMGWPIGPEYAANSNVTLANRLQGKLLLMVGELDTNVDPSSTMQVVNALVKADKDFDLLVLPGSNHGVVGSPYGRRKLQDFLVRNLLHVEPRAN